MMYINLAVDDDGGGGWDNTVVVEGEDMEGSIFHLKCVLKTRRPN